MVKLLVVALELLSNMSKDYTNVSHRADQRQAFYIFLLIVLTFFRKVR
jgi:hypothetical protein